MRPLGKLLLDIVVRARRVGDVEPTLLVEGGGDRPVDQRRSGHRLDREPRGHPEGSIAQLELPGAARHPAGTDQREGTYAAIQNRLSLLAAVEDSMNSRLHKRSPGPKVAGAGSS